jgi:hypothetical protein
MLCIGQKPRRLFVFDGGPKELDSPFNLVKDNDSPIAFLIYLS